MNRVDKDIRLFKENISMHKCGQDKRKHFHQSTNKTAFQNPEFKNKLNTGEKRAWDASENLCRNFLGK